MRNKLNSAHPDDYASLVTKQEAVSRAITEVRVSAYQSCRRHTRRETVRTILETMGHQEAHIRENYHSSTRR